MTPEEVELDPVVIAVLANEATSCCHAETYTGTSRVQATGPAVVLNRQYSYKTGRRSH